ncbi:MAG: SusC/RagA family TonB-linked outer membrane protein, partial [Candidatus Symbiothrix sp.]|nr:SusC/RagA family TonB-linked outer membrane protein [Candidatus Symbiothrix sp.]
VQDESGEPVIGASVVVKGNTSLGTVTDLDGKFSMNVPSDAKTLIVRYLGTQEQEVAAGNNLIIVLKAKDTTLDELVVTSLGIKRQKRELGYATEHIGGEALNQAKSISIATGLQGKVAGLNIASLDNGVLENVKINLRGIRSLTGNNNPMLLLDGVPVALELLNTINPNDVENINVLKGTSAAAIYGPDARNGVIIVTTKRGSKDAKPEVTFSHSTQWSSISFFPKLQTTFGSGGYGDYIPYENWSWGPEFDGSEVELGEVLENGHVQKVPYSAIKNNRKDFFDTGLAMTNDVSYAAENFFLSLQDAKISGIVPNDENRRTGIRLNATQTYGKFSATINTNYIYQKYNVYDNIAMDDYYAANNVGLNEGIMNLIFSTPAHVPLSSYKDFKNNEYGAYNNYFNRYGINPYIALDTWRKTGLDQNLVSNLDLKFSPINCLDLSYRAAVTSRNIVNQYNQKRLVVNSYGESRGIDNVPQSVENSSYINNRLSSEFFANFHKQFGNFQVNALAGTYVRDVLSRTTSVSASNLIIDGLFNVSARPGELSGGSTESHSRLFSIYGSASVNYKNFANLEITGRNDKTSVLSPGHNSFFYPGVNASVVLTDAIPAISSNIMNFFKLRASWNKTGNADISPYRLNATFSQLTDGDELSGFPFNGIPGYSADRTAYDKNLEPEFIETIEAGFEASFLKNRINLDATFYTQDNTNQIVSIRVPRSTGYIFANVNAASFKNYGFETQLKLTPVVNFGDVNINFLLNYAYNNSEVLSIYQSLEELAIGGYIMAGNTAVVGKPAYVFDATDYKRDDQGRVIVDASTGIPQVEEGANKYIGRTMPVHILGLQPSVTWKGLTISALFEYKGGHNAFHMIGSDMAWTGVSEATAANHRERFVFPNSVYEDPNNPGAYIPNTNITIQDVTEFFTSDNYRMVATNFITSAASWRFRELSITYDLPKTLLSKLKVVKGVTVGVVGRNLVLWLPKTNVYSDPDFRGNQDYLTGSNNNIAGISNATVNPPTRTIGGTITVKF